MDFSLDDEQTALRDAVRGLLSQRSLDDRRTAARDEPGYDADTWGRLAAMDLLALPFAEEDGGLGAGPVEVMLVAEEIGRSLAPEPFIDAVLIGGGVVAAAGTPEQRKEVIGALTRGELVPILAHAEPATRWGTNARDVRAKQDDTGWTVTGVKEPVPHGASAGLLIVTALVDDRTCLFLVDPDQPGVKRHGYPTHDGSRTARIELNSATATPLGSEPAEASVLERVFVGAQVALSAEALGAMQEAVSSTVDYLKTRKQFGVPLATFQALTHRAADLYVALELTRSTVQYATMAIARDSTDSIAASRAKLQVGRAGRLIAQESIQLHGGIGMTAEYTVGHYASRLTAIEHTLGDSRHHLGRLAASIGDHTVVETLA